MVQEKEVLVDEMERQLLFREKVDMTGKASLDPKKLFARNAET